MRSDKRADHLRTAPSYERHEINRGSIWSCKRMGKTKLFCTENGLDDESSRSFRRGKWWKYAVKEAEAIRKDGGLIDATAFTKHVVKGPGATKFLDWFTCNKLPSVGRINLTYALTQNGTTRTEYTIVREIRIEYYLVSAGAWTQYDADYIKGNARDKEMEFGYIELQDVTNQWGVFAVAGPKLQSYPFRRSNKG